VGSDNGFAKEEAMRMKKRVKNAVRSPRSATLKTLVRFTRTMPGRAMFVAVLGVLGAAVVIGAARSDAHSDKTVARAALKTSTPPATSAVAAPVAIVESAAKERPQPSSVTITGCLERDAETFRLKDTAGENAPKARSWKSGFFRKGSTSIEIIDAANRVKLPTHVGQRVSVTGTLVDREMQVRSLRRVAASCSTQS
jgi:hypothetical protein